MPWVTGATHALATVALNVFNGMRAFTFQNYTDVNIKTGAQRVAPAILTVNAATQNYITQQPILMQAWHTVTPAAATGATVTYLQPFPILSAGVNEASRIGADTLGLEYVLAPNTEHVFMIDNATVHW